MPNSLAGDYKVKYHVLLKTLILMGSDALFAWLSWVGSVFVFTFLFTRDEHLMEAMYRQAWVVVVACLVFYMACGVYKSLWSHPGIGSIIRITVAALGASFTVYVALRTDMGPWPNPGIGMMAFYFLLSMSVGLRLYKRVWHTTTSYWRRLFSLPEKLPHEPVRTLIVGAGDSASMFLLNPSQHGNRPRNVLGVLDSDHRKHGYHLHGVTIYGDDSMIPKLVKDYDIDEIIVAVPSMKNEDLRRIVRLTPISRCKVRLLGGVSSDKAADKLRDLNIRDLLSRPEAELNREGVNIWLKGKTVLVTGGGGSIGSEICRQLMETKVGKVVIFDISENNAYNLKQEIMIRFGQRGQYLTAVRIGSVQDEARLEDVFAEFKPDIVFHAAAYKHVPLMEECPRLAIDNNVLGTYRTALCACRHGVERFVMISTDKAVNPTNVMGASKRMAELLTLGLNGSQHTEFVCVRFGNVLDSNGSVVPLFRRQIEAGGPITVTHPNIIRYFMTISEAAKLVLEAGAMAAGGEIFILDMGEQVRIADLAENMIRIAGLTPDVDIKIEYTGLRPGEKLYEELLLNEEGLAKTVSDKIFVARPLPAPNLPELVILADGGFEHLGDLRAFLKRFVPEYREA